MGNFVHSLLGPLWYRVTRKHASYHMLDVSRLAVMDKEGNIEPANSLSNRFTTTFISPDKQLVTPLKEFQEDVIGHSGLFLHLSSGIFLKCIVLYLLLWLICAYLLIEKAGVGQRQQRKSWLFGNISNRRKQGETTDFKPLANDIDSLVKAGESSSSFLRQTNVGRAVVDSMMKEFISQTRKRSHDTEHYDNLVMVDMNEEMMQSVMNRLRMELQVNEQGQQVVDSINNTKEPLCKVWLKSCSQLLSDSIRGKCFEKIVQNDKLQQILLVSESWMGRVAIFFFISALLQQFIKTGNLMIGTPW
ncbi:hypothetical protein Gasu2_69660 [Galdieria sulphuraria]|nr:hypothetical protein Gasu2_69660 [Galdieria sulphuraria]